MDEFYTSVIQSGKFLLVRGYNDGRPFKEKVAYRPYHFVNSKVPSDYKSIDGQHLSRIDFGSIAEAREFVEKYSDVENFDVYGFRRYAYNYIYDMYGDMKYDLSKVSIVYCDIECKSENGFPRPEYADQELTAISLRKGDLKITLGIVDYVAHQPNIVYIKCRDEIDLIYKFLDAWKKLDPDILTGWNVEFFDVPYLVNRIKNVLGEEVARQLSPWNQLRTYTQKDKWGKEQSSYEMVGITTIDLMAAYKKFSFKNQESYKLDYIAHVELGEKKIDYSEYSNLNDLYIKDPQKFIEYNIQDNDLVFRIAKKTGLIEQIMELAYGAGVNYADAFGSVLFWEVITKNHLMKEKIVVKTVNKRNYKTSAIMGAFVKEPIPRKYKWVVGFDLDSLYPHLIMQYNISPETLAKRLKSLVNAMPISDILDGRLRENETIVSYLNQGLGYTPNGMFFKNDVRGFLPKLMDVMYNDRKAFKKKMNACKKDKDKAKDPAEKARLDMLVTQYNNIQMSKKIALNSAYGALSNEWFMWYDIDLAEAITYAGQLAIKWVARDLNKYFNKLLNTKNVDYVIASDTDSAYLTLDRLVEATFGKGDVDKAKIVEFLDRVCQDKINPLIDQIYDDLAKQTGAYENKMNMKVESISETGIWTKKKRYALLMWWDEGRYCAQAEIKIKGLEAVQSSTPAICRDNIKKAVEHVLKDEKDELYKLVSDFEPVFKSSSFEAVGATVAPSDIDKYEDPVTIFKPRTPIWVRGSILYNKAIRDKGLDRQYRKINNGDKIKYCYMNLPNPMNQNVFAVFDQLPKELNLSKYIDYDTQFQKEFVEPVNKLARLVGWDIENTNTIESFFA